jgi:16S rRNA (guanine(966)-N(2))-methyltransferase RsmD
VRIIAGEFRGRRLLTPKGRSIRPTSDRVREALFNVIALHVVGSHVLDLFAGTGALGLEALSRGAALAVFVDHDAEAVRLIGENIRLCGAHERARVLRRPILQALGTLAKERPDPGWFDLVFLDPPYGQDQVPAVLERLTELKLVATSALAVAEHHRLDAIPAACGSWQRIKERRYGDTVVSFFTCGSANDHSS